MEVIPAIDLKDGKVVNLKQGRLAETTVYGDDPLARADAWAAAGARRLHLVDLDGAFAGAPAHLPAVRAIASRHPGLSLQLGGGIRTEAAIETCLEAGLDFVILGTRAVEEPAFAGRMGERFPGQVIVGLDGLEGQVAIKGWTEVTGMSVLSLAQEFASAGIAAIIYTDIGKDGMLQGVNAAATGELTAALPVPVIASGGVATLDDLKALLALDQPPAGVITGRALYEGTLDLSEALRLTR